MAIDSYLTIEEMSKLSERVQRWFVAPKSLASTNALRGTIEGVTLEVSHSNCELGAVTEDRYTISARINDTGLGKHEYLLETCDGHAREPKGEEVVKTTFERARAEYHKNRERFKEEDIAHAKSLVS